MDSKSAIRPSSRDAIIDAAIALLAKNPGASISEIAIHAGVGRATLHRHFRKKDDLILAIQKQSLEETDVAVADKIHEKMTALEQLEAMFTAVIPLGDRYHFLSQQVASDDEISAQYAKQLAWLVGLVQALKLEGVVDSQIPDRWAVAQIDQLIWSAWHEVASGQLAAAAAPALALRTFARGVGC